MEDFNNLVDKICEEQNFDDILLEIIDLDNNKNIQVLLDKIENDEKISKETKRVIYDAVFAHIDFSNKELKNKIEHIFRKGVESALKYKNK